MVGSGIGRRYIRVVVAVDSAMDGHVVESGEVVVMMIMGFRSGDDSFKCEGDSLTRGKMRNASNRMSGFVG